MAITITLTLDGESRDLALDSLLISEAREMKRLIGVASMGDFITGLQEADPDSIAFAWWLANRRAGTPLPGKFTDLDFDIEGLRVSVPMDDELETAAEEDADPDLPTGSEEGSEDSTT